MRYRADIDGLRAIAVLLVLVFHFDLFRFGEGGLIGVDIFFVISGFLISSVCWRDLGRGTFSLAGFYLRRIRRLAPALIAVQLAVLALGALTLLPSELRSLAEESFFVQIYLSNIHYWRTVNYFGFGAGTAFLLHTWSLGVEEQFYLFYPLFLLAIHRWRPRLLPAALIGLCAVSLALELAFTASKPEAVFYLLPTRAWELALGALIPFAQPRFERSRRLRELAGPLGLGLIVAALVGYGPNTSFPGWFALLPTLGGVAILLCGAGEGSVTSRLLSNRAQVWIGKISYPLYLVHWPINIFALKLLPSYGLAARWAMFALCIALAWLVYRLVERPVRFGALFKPERRLMKSYAVATVSVLALVAAAWGSHGWRARFSPAVLRVADFADDMAPEEVSMDFNGKTPFAAMLRPIGAPGAAPAWLIVGDSHAGALTEAFDLFLKQRGEPGVAGHSSGCLPVAGIGDPKCRAFMSGALDYLRDHKTIRSVVLVSIWRQPFEGRLEDGSGRIVQGDAALGAFGDALQETLSRLSALGVRSYVWEPLPSMPFSVPQAEARNMAFGLNRPTSISLASHEGTFAFLTADLDHDARLIAGRIKPTLELCRDGDCTGVVDGLPIFRDNNHVAQRRSDLFAKILSDQLEPRVSGR